MGVNKFSSDVLIKGKLKLPNESLQKAAIIGDSGVVTTSPTTSTELGYLSGTTSSVQNQIDSKIPSTEKGSANGVATLDNAGKIPSSQLPLSVMEFKGNWDAATNSPSLVDGTGNPGDTYRVSVAGTQTFNSIVYSFVVGDFIIYNSTVWEKAPGADAVLSVNGKEGVVTIDKTDVGLSNVDNTSDMNKPISTATLTALSAKYDASNPNHYVDSLGAAAAAPVQSVNTKIGDVVLTKSDIGLSNVDNTSDANKPISTATQNALDLKYDASNPANYVNAAGAAAAAPVQSVNGATGTVVLNKNDVGLGNVDNTSDLNKPISTATQTALNGKFNNPTGTTAQYIRGDGSLATFPSSIPTADTAAALVSTVFNETGAAIPKFTVVYINGGHGDMPTITKAQGNAEATSSKTYGITYEDISNMSTGRVIVSGALTGLNTDQFNPTAPSGNVNGVSLWLSPTVAGGVTTTKPSAPDHAVFVGTIVRTHQNQGVVEVKIQNGYELQELHNVSIPNGSAVNKDVLMYDLSTQLWKNTKLVSQGDIVETSFNLSNNQTTAADVTAFSFSTSVVRSFKALISVEIAASTHVYECYEVLGIQKGSGFEISVDSVGDDSGVVFSITSAGQIQYTSANLGGFTSGKIKFRATTTSV